MDTNPLMCHLLQWSAIYSEVGSMYKIQQKNVTYLGCIGPNIYPTKYPVWDLTGHPHAAQYEIVLVVMASRSRLFTQWILTGSVQSLHRSKVTEFNVAS